MRKCTALLEATDTVLSFYLSSASLQLSDNGFTGEIPTEIGLLTKLTALALDGNELSGLLPASLGDLRLLGKFITILGVLH